MSTQKKLLPLQARAVEIRDGGSVHGAGVLGYTVGATVQVVLRGVGSRVTEGQIRKRIEAVLREHLAEIVEVTE